MTTVTDAPDAVQLHPSGRRYHVNCGGEVKPSEEQRCDVSDLAVECEKCGSRWCRGTRSWMRVRAGELTWVMDR